MPKKLPYLSANRSICNIKKYITNVKKLTYEEILWMFRKDTSKRTLLDNHKLIENNLALVFFVTSRLLAKHNSISNYGVDFEDLFQAGCIGLVKAIEKYDSKKYNTKFSTYSVYWIKAKVYEEIRKITYPMKTYSYAPVSIIYNDDPDTKGIKNKQSCNNFYDKIRYDDLIEEIKRILNHEEIEIFSWFFIDSKSMSEIADLINKSISTVFDRIKKIREKLMVKLQRN